MGLFEEFDKVTYQDWLDKINIDLKGKNFQETLVWNSSEGINVQPFYNSSSSIYCSTPLKQSSDWKIRETVFIQSIEEANKKALLALRGGANSLLFIGKIKTQIEIDALLKDIQTDIIEIHFYNSSPKQILELINLQLGSSSYDYLNTLLTTGSWNTDKENDINELAEITASVSKVKTITVNGNYYSNAGYNIIQELAFSLNQAVEYINLLTDKGIEAKQIVSKIQFTFGVGVNYFFEIAKIRAARKLWSLILEQYHVENESMYIHSETSISASEEDKNYNILRNTTKAMSAIVGGCDSLTVLPHDSNESTIDFSNRIARNVQNILKEEAFFDKVNNPSDGAYYIEHLTDEIANKAWRLFQEIEEQEGFLACIENSFIKNKLKKTVDA
jgi:methylmalonyl-CoA mutase